MRVELIPEHELEAATCDCCGSNSVFFGEVINCPSCEAWANLLRGLMENIKPNGA